MRCQVCLMMHTTKTKHHQSPDESIRIHVSQPKSSKQSQARSSHSEEESQPSPAQPSPATATAHTYSGSFNLALKTTSAWMCARHVFPVLSIVHVVGHRSWVVGRGSWVVGRESWVVVRGSWVVGLLLFWWLVVGWHVPCG